MPDKRFPLPQDYEMIPIPKGALPPTDVMYESLYFGNRDMAKRYQLTMLRLFSKPDSSRCDHIDGFAILRTTARLAARYSGVPFPIIHKLTQEYRARAFAITDSADFEPLSMQFIDAICDEVQRFRAQGYSKTVAACVGLILSNFSMSVSVKAMAEKLGVHPNYLSAQFRKETGETISGYIQNIRLEYACHLLTIAPMSLTDIAVYSGFYDQSHFTRIFRQKYGMTPQEYRQKNGIAAE